MCNFTAFVRTAKALHINFPGFLIHNNHADCHIVHREPVLLAFRAIRHNALFSQWYPADENSVWSVKMIQKHCFECGTALIEKELGEEVSDALTI